MRAAMIAALALLASCRGQNVSVTARTLDSLGFSDASPGDSGDSILLAPRLVGEPTVVVFWLPAADTFPPDDQAEALDELNYSTERIAPALARAGIKLVPTNSESIYVALPNRERRLILLSGVDYPFGYVLLTPSGPERILAGLYDEDELLDEIEAYFELPLNDSTPSTPRITT